ncbi:3-dehydroquinate synthase [Alkalihalophilus lindianensis]|uniref:3-dehydroquinate synthase n=1 Tax=Alkalihalophilus lindianensis TaxID=1630542 RepID=A0ABU3X6D6_9BACI|nr:3-dehydroquinate synthase [Alkalihalophilus lindianensis]MDV2683467.1 3-dehydroquinate synthase [Alkalihalophilus lindianensis]
MSTVRITTKSQSYDVVVQTGLRHHVYDLLKQNEIGNYSSVLVITDEHVYSLYASEVVASFPEDTRIYTEVVPAGEASKSFDVFKRLQERALELGLDRHSIIIALGGGVIGDLAGFVAASYMRGIRFIQVPTTLLAHDSSVGGKVAINLPQAKNIVGAFYQPELVIYDTEMLRSLPELEWRSGFAEVIKHGFIRDQQFLKWLTEHVHSFVDLPDDVLEEILVRSIGVKAAIVKEDEREQSVRAFLNLGHTLGHAIEAELGYGKLAHGEAVAIGMIFALRLSEQKFKIDLPINQLLVWLRQLGYQTTIPNGLKPHQLLASMKKDKKTTSGHIRMVLLKEVEDVILTEVSDELLFQSLTYAIKEGFDDPWN